LGLAGDCQAFLLKADLQAAAVEGKRAVEQDDIEGFELEGAVVLAIGTISGSIERQPVLPIGLKFAIPAIAS
jgi:hypothetical protein